MPQARFSVDNQPSISLDEFVTANADDQDVCDWARAAKPGDVFAAFVPCVCVGEEG